MKASTLRNFAVAVLFAGIPLAAGAQTAGGAQSAGDGQSQPVPLVHHAVSTNPDAQAAFDRGLLDYYAYNPEAAEHEFYTAADLDPHLAMAYWGIALSNAPNLNVPPTDDRGNQAREAIRAAKANEADASVEDRSLIDAAAFRFDDRTKATAATLLANYRDALERIALAYPDDPDAAALYAETALYVAFGDRSRDSTAAQRAARAARIAALLPYFRASLAKFPNHVGLLHFYIHAAQMARMSQSAVAAADRLAAFSLPPEDSHLTHMPGHTYFDVGMYDAALGVAKRSVAMDEADFACCHPGYYSAPRYYRDHNVDFLLYALTETGHPQEAIAAARQFGNSTFIARQLVAAGDWHAVLAVPYVREKDATLPFARALAYAKLGDAAQAAQALAAIPNAAADSPRGLVTTAVMLQMLGGEIALAQHDDAKALRLFTEASASADALERLGGAEMAAFYYYSPHIALAQLAVRMGKIDVAKAALQAELVTTPRSPAALRALAQLATHGA
ncbi:MAG TPA: hypothetical protein VIJ77_02740 [Candidatus Tumulicola sp.]